MLRKLSIVILFVLFMLPSKSTVKAQFDEQLGDEPTERELNAPLYPGALFIRNTTSLDSSYNTAIYITLVPIDIVESFFNRKLSEKRTVYYQDKDIYLIVYLLKTWSKFPGSPKKEELEQLETEECVRLSEYNPSAYEPLAEYFDKKPDGKGKASIIRDGKTMIQYTYAASEKDRSPQRIIGLWKEASRDLPAYSGSTLEFRPDGTYVFTLDTGNIDALAKELSQNPLSGKETLTDLKSRITKNNPEKGKYVLVRNTITMVTETPLDGMQNKSGLFKLGTVSLSLELISKPRLSFIRQSQTR